MSDEKLLAEVIAKEHFYCPGPFNAERFACEYALFIILRKQCTRWLKTGQLNHRLALNNAIITLNSFGKTGTNKIVRLTFEEDQLKVMMTILSFLDAAILSLGEPEISCPEVLEILKNDDELRFNLEH